MAGVLSAPPAAYAEQAPPDGTAVNVTMAYSDEGASASLRLGNYEREVDVALPERFSAGALPQTGDRVGLLALGVALMGAAAVICQVGLMRAARSSGRGEDEGVGK